jgi:RNA polymerase sigma-70 factor (ECF subfamily)
LREVEDMRYGEIAAVTNLPMGTVMSRLARARSVLKEHWLLQANGAPHAVP